MDCPFCTIDEIEIILENEQVFAIYDRYPVSKGHILIISRRHTEDYFSLTPREKEAVFNLAEEGRKLLEERFAPDGYNIGANCGRAAGQTIMHFHLHLIPRYHGDIEDPTGGVRGVIPDRRIY